MADFQGLPLTRIEPQSEEDFEIKLSEYFGETKTLQAFYDKNIHQFTKDEHYKTFFDKLRKIVKKSLKTEKTGLSVPEFRRALNHFTKVIEKEPVEPNEFVQTLESIVFLSANYHT